MGALFHVDADRTERCCRNCRHAVERHGIVKRGMHPLVCLVYARAVPYVCGDGSNGLQPYYPCRVAVDATDRPVPMGWEAKDD